MKVSDIEHRVFGIEQYSGQNARRRQPLRGLVCYFNNPSFTNA